MLFDRRPILLANARIIDPSRDLDFAGDLLIADGVIRDAKRGIGAAGVPEGTEIVDCRGNVVAPGLIDMRAFVGEPGGEHRETLSSASQAAAAGGVTTVIDYATQLHGNSLLETIEARRAQADGQVYIDYGLHAIVVDLGHGQVDELPELVEMGIPSVKVYTTYRDAKFYSDDLTILRLLEGGAEPRVVGYCARRK